MVGRRVSERPHHGRKVGQTLKPVVDRFAISAAMAGVATWRIRKQTGHASDVMLSRYIRDGELFEGNAAGVFI